MIKAAKKLIIIGYRVGFRLNFELLKWLSDKIIKVSIQVFLLSDDGKRSKVGKLLVDVVLVVLVRPQADHPRLRRLGGHKMSEQTGGLAVVLNLG